MKRNAREEGANSVSCLNLTSGTLSLTIMMDHADLQFESVFIFQRGASHTYADIPMA